MFIIIIVDVDVVAVVALLEVVEVVVVKGRIDTLTLRPHTRGKVSLSVTALE